MKGTVRLWTTSSSLAKPAHEFFHRNKQVYTTLAETLGHKGQKQVAHHHSAAVRPTQDIRENLQSGVASIRRAVLHSVLQKLGFNSSSGIVCRVQLGQTDPERSLLSSTFADNPRQLYVGGQMWCLAYMGPAVTLSCSCEDLQSNLKLRYGLLTLKLSLTLHLIYSEVGAPGTSSTAGFDEPVRVHY